MDKAGLPRMRIALFGPAGVGKSTFRSIILRGSPQPRPHKDIVEREITRVYRIPTRILGDVGRICYILRLIDVPGSEEYVERRVKALRKACGYIFFYDSTKPDSAKKLLAMIKEELETRGLFKSLIAAIVVGTKKDYGARDEALMEGQNIADYISKYTVAYYGYRVPHVLISCTNRDEASRVLECVESILFEMRPRDDTIRNIVVPLGGTPVTPIEPLEGLADVYRVLEGEEPIMAKHEKYETWEGEEKLRSKFFELRLSTSNKLWNLAKALAILFPNIDWCCILNYSDGAYFVAHSGDTKLSDTQKDIICGILGIIGIARELGDIKTMTLSFGKYVYHVFRGPAIVILRTRASLSS